MQVILKKIKYHIHVNQFFVLKQAVKRKVNNN